MKSVTVTEKLANKRIDKFIKESFPRMPVSAMHKAFRKKDIKVNGIRVKDDYIVTQGDNVEVFIVDHVLEGAPLKNSFQLSKGFSIVYEDENILIVNKEQGIPVHPDKAQSTNTLIDLVQEYLEEKGVFNRSNPNSFPPSLCHRLDRNTSGLVIVAKNCESLSVLLEKIKDKEVKKYYQCLVKGEMEKDHEELKAYLVKDDKKSRVFIDNRSSKGSVEIITRYKVISCENDISKLEVELVTGKTHQIRAHLAHIGHPIVGDGKYGSNMYNRSLGLKYQALCAYKIVFDFKSGSILNYLKGKKFEIEPEFNISKPF